MLPPPPPPRSRFPVPLRTMVAMFPTAGDTARFVFDDVLPFLFPCGRFIGLPFSVMRTAGPAPAVVLAARALRPGLRLEADLAPWEEVLEVEVTARLNALSASLLSLALAAGRLPLRRADAAVSRSVFKPSTVSSAAECTDEAVLVEVLLRSLRAR